MSELTAKEYFKMRAKMTKRKEDNCNISCYECGLFKYNNGRDMACFLFERSCPEEAIAIVEKWNEEHPLETNLQHYAKELRKLGYCVEEETLRYRCPTSKSFYFGKGKHTACDCSCGCAECQKWWYEEYKPSDEEKGD